MAASQQNGEQMYNSLGGSGLQVSNICLGAMAMGTYDKSSNALVPPMTGELHKIVLKKLEFGLNLYFCLLMRLEYSRIRLTLNKEVFFDKNKPGQLNEADAHAMLNRYTELGGNFIDTADFYSAGGSETIIGSWLAQRERDRHIIATKVRFGWDPTDPNASGLSRKRIISCIEKSLKRLQTDYVDLYQMHCWDNAVPIKETLLTLNDLVRCGKVRYLGASNLTGWQMQKIVDLSENMGFSPFSGLQQQYSLLNRESEWDVFHVCQNDGIGVLPWSPLKGGLLTGKYKRGEQAGAGTRLAWADKTNVVPEYLTAVNSDQYWDLVDALQRIAQEKGKTVAQVSLRWLLQKDVVSSVIVGATKISQLEDNMGAATGWTLSPEEMALLDKMTEPTKPYPYSFNDRVNPDRVSKHKL